MTHESTNYKFVAAPPFEGLRGETAAAVGLVMKTSLGIMHSRGVEHFQDEYGEGWAYVSPDQRLAIESRHIPNGELTKSTDVRAYLDLDKRRKRPSVATRLFVATQHQLLYLDREHYEGGIHRATEVISKLTYEIPAAYDQPCRWVGLMCRFEDAKGNPDPKGEDFFFNNFDDRLGNPNRFDEFAIGRAAEQIVMSAY